MRCRLKHKTEKVFEMEREDLIIRAGSPTIPEQEVSPQVAVARETLIPRSTSAEDLQKMVANAESLPNRDALSVQELKKCKQAMKDAFYCSFSDCREMIKSTVSIRVADALEQSLRRTHPIFKKLTEQKYAQIVSALLKYAFPEPFKEIKELQGRLSPEVLDNTLEFYTVECFVTLYDVYIKGGNLYKDTKKKLIFQCGSMVFIHRVSPIFLKYHFFNLVAEIFDYSFELYQSEPLLYRIKNAMILFYICLEVYEKLINDILACYKTALFTNTLRMDVNLDMLRFLSKGTQDLISLVSFLDNCQLPSQEPEAELKRFSDNFSTYFREYKKHVREIQSHALNLDYVAFYLSKHETPQMALDNHNVFPQDILSAFIASKSISGDHLRQFVMVDEAEILQKLSTKSYENFYSRSNFFLAWDQCHFSTRIRFLEDKLKSVKIQKLKDDFSGDIYRAIQPLLLKLKTMDLASPAYKIDDINAIYEDLIILQKLIENLQSIAALVQDGSLKMNPAKTVQRPVKKKQGKKKKKQQVSVPVIVAPLPAPVPVVPKKVAPSKMSQQKNPEIIKISEISKRIIDNLQKEKQYYQAAKTYILSLVSNAQARGLVEVLFNPKSNLKNIMSQKEMTLIVEQMSTRVDASSENLKGSNGFRFRVGAEIYTCHASTAEIGHKGHGGAIRAFRDFLIAVYTVSLTPSS